MMSTQLVYRDWTASDDYVALTRLLHRAYQDLADLGFRYTATWQTPEITRDRVERGRCTVAESDGRYVGTITLYRLGDSGDCDWYGGPGVAHFGQFGVDPDHRGQGVGRRLLELVEIQARDSGATDLALDTAEVATHLIELYHRKGYGFVQHVQWTQTNYRSVVLNKNLRE